MIEFLFSEWWGQLAVVLGCLFAIGTAVRKVVVFFRGAVTTISEAIDSRIDSVMDESIDEAVDERMTPILHELRPNGGSSFRDDVNGRLDALNSRLDTQHEQISISLSSLNRLSLDHQETDLQIAKINGALARGSSRFDGIEARLDALSASAPLASGDDQVPSTK